MDRRERANDLGESVLAAMIGHQADMWTALPGVIVDFDKTKMTAHVQPTIMAKVQDRFGAIANVKLPVLPDVVVQFPSGGGVTLTFPVAPGDECLLVFSSRCIDAWHQLGAGDTGAQVQVEQRMHDLSDAIAIVGIRSLPNVPGGISTTGAELRTDDGLTRVKVQQNGDLEIDSQNGSLQINVPTGPINIRTGGQLTAVADTAIIQATTVKIIGDLIVEGKITQTGGVSSLEGPVSVTNELSAQGINVHNHQHGGVQNGGSKTGPPVNF